MKDYLKNRLSEKDKYILFSLLYAWRFPRDILYCLVTLKTWHHSWRLFGLPHIYKHPTAKIYIGKKWTACSIISQNSLGVFQKVIIKALGPNSVLIIEDDVGMSGVTIACGEKIIIGAGALIGSGTLITDTDSHAIHPKFRKTRDNIKSSPVIIEKEVFIGARSIILKGVTIGEGSVVGAGSVVTKNIPPMSIVAGNPAKVIGNVLDSKHVNC